MQLGDNNLEEHANDAKIDLGMGDGSRGLLGHWGTSKVNLCFYMWVCLEMYCILNPLVDDHYPYSNNHLGLYTISNTMHMAPATHNGQYSMTVNCSAGSANELNYFDSAFVQIFFREDCFLFRTPLQSLLLVNPYQSSDNCWAVFKTPVGGDCRWFYTFLYHPIYWKLSYSNHNPWAGNPFLTCS